MTRRLRPLMPAAVALVMATGCLSKTWVQEELDRRDTRLEQNLASLQSSTARAQRDASVALEDAGLAQRRVNAIDERIGSVGQRMGSVDQRIGTLEARTTELHERAQGAATRADGATARAEGVDARLTRLWASRNVRTVVNVLQVEFRFDQSVLDDTAKSMLFVMVREVRENPELALDLEGFTDSKGSHQYNVRLSQRRVEAVRRYLIEQGVEQHRIRASARGPVGSSAVPEERKRRVDVKLVVTAD